MKMDFLIQCFLADNCSGTCQYNSLMLSTDHIDGTKLMLFLCDIRSDFFSSSHWRSALKKHKWLNFHRASNWMPLNYGSKPLCIYYWQSTSVCEASVFLWASPFLSWRILENNNIHHISSLTFSGLRSLVLLWVSACCYFGDLSFKCKSYILTNA